MRTLCISVLAVLVNLIQTPFVDAWNAAGHKTVAEVAWRKLEPATRAAVVDVLRQHPRFNEDFAPRMQQEVGQQDESVKDHWIFCHAATWPDIARDQPEFHRATWHFINLPVFLSNEDADAFGGQLPVNVKFDPAATPNEIDHNAVQAIKTSLHVLANPSTTDGDKAVRLCWLLHVIPDIAQPLHSSALFSTGLFPRGDKGGGKISVRRDGTRGEGRKLHSVWDGLLGTNANFDAIRSKADQFIQSHQSDFAASFIALPDDVWTTECQQLAVTWAYEPLLDEIRDAEESGRPLRVIDVPESYFEKAGAVARRQAVISGVRLAGVLQQAMQRNPPVPAFASAELGFPAAVARTPRSRSISAERRATTSEVDAQAGDQEDLAARVAHLEAEVKRLNTLLHRRAIDVHANVGRASVTTPSRREMVAAAVAAEPDEEEQCSCDEEH